jgi:hypothetical protein
LKLAQENQNSNTVQINKLSSDLALAVNDFNSHVTSFAEVSKKLDQLLLLTGTIDAMKEDLMKLNTRVEHKIGDLDATIPAMQQKISIMEATIASQVII